MRSRKQEIELGIKNQLDRLDTPKRLKESMEYSHQAGGKRLRPVLVLASYETFDHRYDKAMSTAIALEMVHTYSLIHDDLPAMDNDDYRRGTLTNHKASDEATAILSGDALLTYAFEIIGQDEQLTNEEKVYVITKLAQASGATGMVAGQMLDLNAEGKKITLDELENIHTLKTGKLIAFAITVGAYLAKADEKQLQYLQTFSNYLGLIFQIQDDILDITGDEEKIGKPVGSDKLNEKNTYPNILGLEGAIKQKNKYVDLAYKALNRANADESYLMELTNYFSQREF